jgi:hypothetical protein
MDAELRVEVIEDLAVPYSYVLDGTALQLTG